MARATASEIPTTSPPSAGPCPSPIVTWSPIRAWLLRPAISSAAVPTAVTRPTRRPFGTRATSAPSAAKSVSTVEFSRAWPPLTLCQPTTLNPALNGALPWTSTP